MSTSTPNTLRGVIDELETIRDMVRVRTHLLSLEGKAQWHDLQSQLSAAEEALHRQARPSVAHIGELLKSAHSFLDEQVKRP